MSENETYNLADTVDNDERNRFLTRRKFLRRGALAGLGAAALYVAPSMSSTRAKRAYAGITGDCTDTISPVIKSILTGSVFLPPTLEINTAEGGYITATATDNEALAEIEIELVGISLVIGDAYFTCADPVKSASYTRYFDPFELEVGFYNGTATATDCCGNEGSKSFDLKVTNLGSR